MARIAHRQDGRQARFAVIDVGTNSVKCLIAERAADGSWRRLVDRAEVTRLGEGLEESGRISEAALARTLAAVEGMVADARSLGSVGIAAVGTAGLRAASNAEDVIRTVASRTGIRIEVITGEEEGRLANLAVGAGLAHGLVVLRQGSFAVFDTGGGSSQFTFGRDGRIEDRFSLPVGAVRYVEGFGLDRAASAERLAEAMAAISADLGRLDRCPRPDALVGMGGAITNLTAVKLQMQTYDPEVVHGSTLERAEVERQIERFRRLDADRRRGIVGLQPTRAEVILAGACVVRTVMEKLGQDVVTVSDRGLRHGVLQERFGA